MNTGGAGIVGSFMVIVILHARGSKASGFDGAVADSKLVSRIGRSASHPDDMAHERLGVTRGDCLPMTASLLPRLEVQRAWRTHLRHSPRRRPIWA